MQLLNDEIKDFDIEKTNTMEMKMKVSNNTTL